MDFPRAWLVTMSRTLTLDADIVCRVYPEHQVDDSERFEPVRADIEDIRLGASGALRLDPDDLDRYERMEIEGSAIRAATQPASVRTTGTVETNRNGSANS